MEDDLRKILDDHEKRISELEAHWKTKPEPLKKDLSPKEFLLTKTVNDDIQKTLSLGFYLERHRRLSVFNAKDLESIFREAKENPPENINDKVNKNIQKGFMMEAREKKDKLKAWNLTTSGEKFVEESLDAKHS